jgi:hypothetical protein
MARSFFLCLMNHVQRGPNLLVFLKMLRRIVNWSKWLSIMSSMLQLLNRTCFWDTWNSNSSWWSYQATYMPFIESQFNYFHLFFITFIGFISLIEKKTSKKSNRWVCSLSEHSKVNKRPLIMQEYICYASNLFSESKRSLCPEGWPNIFPIITCRNVNSLSKLHR